MAGEASGTGNDASVVSLEKGHVTRLGLQRDGLLAMDRADQR
jgi:hypothetical protein